MISQSKDMHFRKEKKTEICFFFSLSSLWTSYCVSGSSSKTPETFLNTVRGPPSERAASSRNALISRTPGGLPAGGPHARERARILLLVKPSFSAHQDAALFFSRDA